MQIYKSKQGQAMPPKTVPMAQACFSANPGTTVYWLGNASIMINCHGDIILIDPLLENLPHPPLIALPITAAEMPPVDGVLITHIDFDHLSLDTCKRLACACKEYHAPNYTAHYMQAHDLPATSCEIGVPFQMKHLCVTPTPTLHNWHDTHPNYAYRRWKESDYCGYWLETPEGTIWLPGDSRLLPSHLTMRAPDMILFDFSNDAWHITLEGAIQLANAYPQADLLCIHWGSVDTPNFAPFNANPEDFLGKIVNPARIQVVAAGTPVPLVRKEAKQKEV